MATKIEWAQQIRAAGMELPENWGKLSTSRAEAVKDKLLGTSKRTIGSALGRLAGAMVGAVVGLGAAAVEATADVVAPTKEEKPARRAQSKAATMPKDPKWKRTTGGGRGGYPARKLATDPEPMTRQVRRQNERREQKMPIGARQDIWHKTMGFGKVGKGKRRAAAAA